jgi:PAS domain S-box-containing protein
MRDEDSLYNRSDAGVGLADERGKFVVFNRAAEQLLGIAGDDVGAPDWKWHSLHPAYGADCPPLESLVARAMCGQNVPATELFLPTHGASLGFWVHAAARPLVNDAGDVCGGVVVFRKLPKHGPLDESRSASPAATGKSASKGDAAKRPAPASARRHIETFSEQRSPASGQAFGGFKEDAMSDATLHLNFSSPINYQVRHVVRLVRSADLDVGVDGDGRRAERNVLGETPCSPARDAVRRMADELAAAQGGAKSTRPTGFSKDEEDHIRQLLDSAAEAICEIDLAGDCTLANPACARLLGYREASELLGKNLHALTHGRRADGAPYPEEECPVHRNYCCDDGVHVEEVFWRADGTSFYAECRSMPILRDDRVVGAAVTFMDITDRKLLEEQLRQAQKMEAVGQFVGGIAHDFNNFLTAINIYNELLTASLGSNIPALQLLREVKEATERSASLTRQLLAFGGKRPMAAQTLCINEVVRNAEVLLRRVVAHDVDLHTSLDPRLAKVNAEQQQLERVLLNLVLNARHAMPEGGRITIESANVTIDAAADSGPGSLPAGRYVALSVSDTGAGMSPEVKRRIFEPFFTTKGKENGSGLGLAVVQGIVKQLKGRIEVDSEPGRGACFTIYLPAAEQPKPYESLPATRAETILYVDLDKSLRKATCELLVQFGFQPLEASSSEEAELISSQCRESISMLVTGVSISPEESEALAARLRPLRPKLKTLCLSGSADRPPWRYDAAHELPPPHGRTVTPVSLSEKIRKALEGN